MRKPRQRRLFQRRFLARHGAGLAGAAGLVCVSASLALAQGLLPVGAPTVELGDLRRAFARAYDGAAPGGSRTWTISPSIDLETRFTDNARALGTGGRAGSELVTTISPSMAILGDSQRLRGSLIYSPQFRSYANSPRENSVSQNLSAEGRATIFEELLFLNASAYAAEQSRNGGLNRTTGTLNRSDRVQTTSLSVSPELQHRFRDYGSVLLRYTYSYLTQSGRNITANTPFSPGLSNKPSTTNSVQASFNSGPEFGRVAFGVNVNQSVTQGSGVRRNSRRSSEVVNLDYAVTRNVTALSEIGHQEIRYGGVRPVTIGGVLWSVGLRWNPGPETSITARYGRRDGGNSVSLDASTAPTARTRVSVSYSESVSTAEEDLLRTLGRVEFDAFGNAIDPRTGLPLALSDNFAGARGGVARNRVFTVTGVLLRDIDTVSVSFQRNERTTLSSDTPGAVPSTTGLSGSLDWQRELGPGLRGNASFTYGTRSATGSFPLTQDTISFTSGLTYSFSDTLSARGSYSFLSSNSNQPGFSYSANMVTLGLRKGF